MISKFDNHRIFLKFGFGHTLVLRIGGDSSLALYNLHKFCTFHQFEEFLYLNSCQKYTPSPWHQDECILCNLSKCHLNSGSDSNLGNHQRHSIYRLMKSKNFLHILLQHVCIIKVLGPHKRRVHNCSRFRLVLRFRLGNKGLKYIASYRCLDGNTLHILGKSHHLTIFEFCSRIGLTHSDVHPHYQGGKIQGK